MEIFQIQEDNALGNLLSHIVINYLAKLYCICVIWSATSAPNFNSTLNIMLKNTQNNSVFPNFYLIMTDNENGKIRYNHYSSGGGGRGDGNDDDGASTTAENNNNGRRRSNTFAPDAPTTMENLNFDKVIESGINFGCQAYIVSSTVAVTFLNSFSRQIPLSLVRYSSNHLIFVNTEISENNTAMVDRILNHPIILDIANILIVSPSSKNTSTKSQPILNQSLSLFSSPPTLQSSSSSSSSSPSPSSSSSSSGYTSENKNNNIVSTHQNKNRSTAFDLITSQFVGRLNNSLPIWLDTFYGQTTTFKVNANLFPDKLTNLHQRHVRLALFNYIPYSVWEEVTSGQGNAIPVHSDDEEKTLLIDGTESLMLLEFCSKHNCTLEISMDEAGEWGEIFDNWTGTGVLGAVAEGRADVGISALYEWHHEYRFLDFTTPIARTGITCIVPRPKLLSGLYLPAMPFSWQLWLAVFISFIIGVIALVVADKIFIIFGQKPRLQFGYTFMQIGAVYLLQSPSFIMNRSTEMMIMGPILLIALMIGNAYSGGLASIMTLPQYEPPIDTAHQLAERNMDWGATQDAWIYSILLATQPDMVKLVSLFHPQPSDYLKSRTKTADFAFSLERLPYGSFAIGEYITEDAIDYLQLMHQDIYYEYSLAMTRKCWMLKDELDTLILNVVQSGIQQMWEWKSVSRFSDNKVQLGVASSRISHHGAGPNKLSTTRLVGAFIIWGIGMLGGFIIFIIEYHIMNR